MFFSDLDMWKPIRIGDKCEEIINILKEGERVSGEYLAENLRCSRTAVWKCIRRLRELKYNILSSPRGGYRLVSSPDIPYPWEIKGDLKIFRNFFYFDEIDSTNTRLFEMAKNGAPEGTVIIADRQLKGKGRHGRVWISPPGNIYMSILVRPRCKVQDGMFITLLSGVAVARSIKKFEVDVMVKWPNDIMVGGKKLCGILCESEVENGNIDFMVVGIGVNLHLPETNLTELKMATSLSECGVKVSRNELIRSILKNFEELYSQFLKGEKEGIRRMYLKMTFRRGDFISVKTGSEIIVGRFLDVDRDGALIILDSDGNRKKLYSAEVM